MDNMLVLFFKNVVSVTGVQLVGLFGVFFFLGFILSLLQNGINRIYQRSFGWKGILWTAWIGTPFHELGHAFFCLIFLHKIEHISLFTPNEHTGGLGHVDHSYRRKNVYQSVGNFFIGAAPMIWGIGIVAALLYTLHPFGKEIMATLLTAKGSISELRSSLPHVLSLLFSRELLSSWSFWLFLYVSFAISAHIAPSSYDRRGMWSGFLWIVILLITINTVLLLFHINITSLLLETTSYIHIFAAIALYSIILSSAHLILVSVLSLPARILKR